MQPVLKATGTDDERTCVAISRARAAVLAGLVAIAAGAVALVAWQEDDDVARSVIFVNGDGMAAVQRQAATLALEGVGGTLVMDRLAVTGSQTTDPDDPEEVVTDSAAAATAWATGTKTANRRLSTTPDGSPLRPLGREAKQAGKATGLVTTAPVTDASPAAFFASVPDRGDQEAIAAQYLDISQPDVVLGGGASRWSPELLAQAERSGYDVLDDAADVRDARGSKLLGLFADKEMWTAADEPAEEPAEQDAGAAAPAPAEVAAYDPAVSLADMTSKALDVLSRDEDGFFLVVEEEAVDGMGHANNGTLMLEAMRALDEAVAVAVAYVEAHPDTLLIVTGDHEAGGLTLEDADEGREDGPFAVAGSDLRFSLDWTSDEHTGVPTPVTAEGPGSERLAGSYPNTHIHTVLRDTLLGG